MPKTEVGQIQYELSEWMHKHGLQSIAITFPEGDPRLKEVEELNSQAIELNQYHPKVERTLKANANP